MTFRHSREEARKLCIEALRSGKYQQGELRLCAINEQNEEKHCCLGVFCRVFNEHEPEHALTLSEQPDQKFGRCIVFRGGAEVYHADGTAGLPSVVINWLGLNGRFGPRAGGPSLTQLNDNGKDFLWIADAMETGSFYAEEGL